jgi:peptide/nickel transport system permease protein
VLPAVTLALPVAALLGQVLRDGLVQAERMPFAETVRARGASAGWFTLRHGLRHGASGAVTLTAYLTGSVLGGAVLVETVFARPGLGRVTLAAISDRDLPVISGIILLSALVFVTVNVIVELVHPLIDPRLRVARRESLR